MSCDTICALGSGQQGGSGCTSVDPILVAGSIPTEAEVTDVIVPGLPASGIAAIAFWYSTNDDDTPQSESCFGTCYYVRFQTRNTYSAGGWTSAPDPTNAGCRIQGDTVAFGIQTRGPVPFQPFYSLTDISAAVTEIAGGFRITWTFQPVFDGLNQGGRWWGIVFPVGDDTNAQLVYGLDNDAITSPSNQLGILTDAILGTQLGFKPHGHICSSILNFDCDFNGARPFCTGFDDFNKQALVAEANNFGLLTTHNTDTGVCGQFNNANGSIAWRGRQFRRDGSFYVDGFTLNFDRLMSLFLRGYNFSVHAVTKTTGTSQLLPDFGFTPTVILGMTAVLPNDSGRQDETQRNNCFAGNGIEQTISICGNSQPNRQYRNVTRDTFFALDRVDNTGTYIPGVTGSLDAVSQQPTLTWSAATPDEPELYLCAIGPRPVCP